MNVSASGPCNLLATRTQTCVYSNHGNAERAISLLKSTASDQPGPPLCVTAQAEPTAVPSQRLSGWHGLLAVEGLWSSDPIRSHRPATAPAPEPAQQR